MLSRITVASLLVLALLAGNTVGETKDQEKQEKLTLKGVKCLFCKMDVNKDEFVEYKGAKVFFGCGGCPQAFKKDAAKYATKANAQLVSTNQARQKACPLSGGATNDEFTLAVAGTKVSFCCGNCKSATAKLAADAQLEKVFSEAAFKKAFEVRKGEKKG